MSGYFLLTLCFWGVSGVFYDEVTVLEGDSVTLSSGITKQHHEIMCWYFNDTLIAHISEDASNSCLYDGEGWSYRDQLEVNYQTGSLTITNTRSEHTGRYELEIIRNESSGKRQSLNRNSKCDRTKITRKHSSDDDDVIKTFNLIVIVIVTDADEYYTNFDYYDAMDQDYDTMIFPKSGQSPVAKAGIFVAAVAVILLLV